MTNIRLAAPFLAIALAALPATRLHAQQYGPQQQGSQQGDRNPGQHDSGQWDTPPSEFHDTARQGFHDGIEAARFDMENQRGMDPHSSRMFRHPPVERNQRQDYRQGFIQGYNEAMHHAHDGDHRDRDGDHHDAPPPQPNSF